MQPLMRAHQASVERLQRGEPLHMKHSKNNTTGIALTGCSMSSRKYLAVSSTFDELKDILCKQEFQSPRKYGTCVQRDQKRDHDLA